MEQKFYICKHCGNIIAKVKDTGVPVVCCGEPMSEIIPGTTDAAVEKHVPVWTVENGIVHVKVGSVEHPMLPEHYIEWVSLHTKQGNQRKAVSYTHLAQDGKVKTIIVKDFSRFARDYIEAGDYMERIFPLLGVRFISVNDGYDSGMQAGNDVRGLEVAIKNIINASYSRDLSAKIAAADHVMQKKGMYLGGYRPFGFLSDPNDCHELILDPVASRYVRLIFELALQGNRTGTIAKILNEKQIRCV